MAEHPSAFDDDDPLVERVRLICLRFPEAIEVSAWGHPTFRAAKPIFATISSPRGFARHAVVFKPDPEDAPALKQDARIFSPPYWGKSGWLGIGIDDPHVDWQFLAELIDASYRQVALVRQVKQLDAR